MLPLDGVRILDFFWLGAGPVGSLALSELGADVIRVESQARLDKLRESGPYPGAPSIDHSGVFASINYGKRSISVNLGREGATRVVDDLVKHCDVVTNNFKASTLGRYGLSFDEVRKHNPRVVYITMSTMGAAGPCSSYGAYGSHLSAMAGINGVTGAEEEVPVGLGPLVPDFSCNPFHAAVAILAGLRHVRTTGEAVSIDVSQLESTIHLIGPLVKQASLTGRQPARVGPHHPWRSPHGVFRCDGDDEWITVSVGTDEQWDTFVSVLGGASASWGTCNTFLGRRQKTEEIRLAIESWASTRGKWQAATELLAAGVPAWPVSNLRDQLEIDGDLRGQFARVALDEQAAATVQRFPIAIAGHAEPLRPPPRLGEHTFDVLKDILGYGEEQIANLVATGVLE